MQQVFERIITLLYMLTFAILFIPLAIIGGLCHVVFCSINAGYGYVDHIVKSKIAERMKKHGRVEM